MRRMSCLLVVFVLIGGTSCKPAAPVDADDLADTSAWKLKPPAPDAIPVAADKQLPGIYPAGSRLKDPNAIGGFGPCGNYPKDMGDKTWGTKGTVTLVAFPEEPVAYFKDRGIALRLVNRSGQVMAFSASDSQLYIVQEARDADGQWRAIESLPATFCGNGFHRVFLNPDQYWEFRARLYSGPITTKIRFRLNSLGETGEGQPTYSNEFEGQVAKVQFPVRAN